MPIGCFYALARACSGSDFYFLLFLMEGGDYSEQEFLHSIFELIILGSQESYRISYVYLTTYIFFFTKFLLIILRFISIKSYCTEIVIICQFPFQVVLLRTYKKNNNVLLHYSFLLFLEIFMCVCDRISEEKLSSFFVWTAIRRPC